MLECGKLDEVLISFCTGEEVELVDRYFCFDALS
jgi:hypothetical protein